MNFMKKLFKWSDEVELSWTIPWEQAIVTQKKQVKDWVRSITQWWEQSEGSNTNIVDKYKKALSDFEAILPDLHEIERKKKVESSKIRVDYDWTTTQTERIAFEKLEVLRTEEEKYNETIKNYFESMLELLSNSDINWLQGLNFYNGNYNLSPLVWFIKSYFEWDKLVIEKISQEVFNIFRWDSELIQKAFNNWLITQDFLNRKKVEVYLSSLYNNSDPNSIDRSLLTKEDLKEEFGRKKSDFDFLMKLSELRQFSEDERTQIRQQAISIICSSSWKNKISLIESLFEKLRLSFNEDEKTQIRENILENLNRYKLSLQELIYFWVNITEEEIELSKEKKEREKVIDSINKKLEKYKNELNKYINELKDVISFLLSQVQDYEDSVFTQEKVWHAKESFAIYKWKSFELDNPSETQKRVVRIFQAFLNKDERLVKEWDLFNPIKGMFLYGKPWRWKTHTTMVFALELFKAYKSQIEKMFSDFQSNEQTIINWYVSLDSLTMEDLKEKDKLLEWEVKALPERVNQFKQQLQSIPPISSLLHIVHNDKIKMRLWDWESHKELVHELATYPYLILDELYIKDWEIEYADFFKQLVEARYQSGRFGMFLTSNMQPRETLAWVDPKRFDMIFSRLNEMNMIANLDDQKEDYRHKSTGKLFDSF